MSLPAGKDTIEDDIKLLGGPFLRPGSFNFE
jgi:hypothetical protein